VRVDQLRKEFPIEVEFRSFQLNPEGPPEGVSVEDYFGSRDRFERSFRYVQTVAEGAGLSLNSIRIISNSYSAFEVGELAKDEGKFATYQQKIYEAYFRDGKDIGNPKVIIEVAKQAGLSDASVHTILDHGTMKSRVERDILSAERMRVTGVPVYFIGVYRIIGAQPYDVFRNAVQQTIGSNH
jgi:predicted DsbA family dithiol-disulfide isomerase